MLPHIKNSQAGIQRWDPVFNSIFEVAFTIPDAIRDKFGGDEAILTEHVLKVGGLDNLQKSPGTGQQKFMGTDRSYIKPVMDSTHAEPEITFSLNLRNGTDNYIYKLLRAWCALGYDLLTGTRTLKANYCADWMRISIANQAGDIYRQVLFKDIMPSDGLSGWSDLDYTSDSAQEITLKFVSDWWDDEMV